MPRITYTKAKLQSAHFDNQWASRTGFTYLGAINAATENTGQRYELYAIANGDTISFGARYGHQPQDYLSGGAGLFQDINSDSPIGIAAREYVQRMVFRTSYIHQFLPE